MISKVTINILSHQIYELCNLHWFDWDMVHDFIISCIVAQELRLDEDAQMKDMYSSLDSKKESDISKIKIWCENNLITK